ncbi:amino acid ABC transporter ATP-binding protein, partial [Streptococcus sobrinus]
MADLKIDVQDLHKSYGDNEVLKGIDAQFNEGDVVCIIGPSGSGKSTFLRTLNLLESITSGKVIVDGYELSDPKTDVDKVRENIGMVFQHFNLFPHMSVLDNIIFAPVELGKYSKEEAEKVGMDLLEKVGLSDKRDVSPESLSG